ncbi:MAG: glycosyltransferase family 2 protein [Opitutaceae bacterium]
MNPPRISVLVPTYRYGRFLAEAIESVLAQDFADFELIISDDASDDDSAEVIARYAARDARIRARIQPANLGMVPNWNACLEQARGEYVKIVFGDDSLPARHALGRMAALLDGEPRAALAVSARALLDERSATMAVRDELGPAGYRDGPEVIARCLRADRNLVGEPSAVMFRRAAARRGFDASFRQLVDEEMWFHLLAGGGLVHTPEPLCAFRLHASQMSAANRRASVASTETMRLVARYYEFFLRSAEPRPRGWAARRRLFRHIHYARKEARGGPEAAEAEALLRSKLGRGAYALCWLLHRFAKPWENLLRRRGAFAP